VRLLAGGRPAPDAAAWTRTRAAAALRAPVRPLRGVELQAGGLPVPGGLGALQRAWRGALAGPVPAGAHPQAVGGPARGGTGAAIPAGRRGQAALLAFAVRPGLQAVVRGWLAGAVGSLVTAGRRLRARAAAMGRGGCLPVGGLRLIGGPAAVLGARRGLRAQTVAMGCGGCLPVGGLRLIGGPAAVLGARRGLRAGAARAMGCGGCLPVGGLGPLGGTAVLGARRRLRARAAAMGRGGCLPVGDLRLLGGRAAVLGDRRRLRAGRARGGDRPVRGLRVPGAPGAGAVWAGESLGDRARRGGRWPAGGLAGTERGGTRGWAPAGEARNRGDGRHGWRCRKG
jgi:hypothetical protein